MRVHVGAYPTYGPPDTAEAAAVVTLLAESPLVAGLEVPFADGRLLLPTAPTPSDWRHVVTLIPATMTALAVDDQWGPASRNAAGREAAVELLRSVRDVVSARTDVAAVELQSAPTRTGSAAVFA
ncbi:MAG TPA: DUF4862 family protein, partial [Propionibacteriaceae bacterium]|nr:DUF4862 family protein [Propionibacteriaceae bacterium]